MEDGPHIKIVNSRQFIGELEKSEQRQRALLIDKQSYLAFNFKLSIE